MYMVSINRTGMDHHLVASLNFPDQFPRSKPTVPYQNRITILEHPYDVILTVPDRMTSRLRRFHPSGCYASFRLKARGSDDRPKIGSDDSSGPANASPPSTRWSCAARSISRELIFISLSKAFNVVR